MIPLRAATAERSAKTLTLFPLTTKQAPSLLTARFLRSMPRRKLQNLPWGEIGVDVVLECTGFYCSKEKSQAHIDAGAKKVVISAPAGNDLHYHRFQR